MTAFEPQNQADSPVVVSLQVCPAHRAPMEKRESVRAITNMGLEGDRHARPDVPRQVLLVEQEVLDKFGLPAGEVKENITTRGIALNSLPVGTRLRIGAALLEVTIECTPCSRMDEIRDGLREVLKGQRGMLARVVEGGTLRMGDAIEVERAS